MPKTLKQILDQVSEEIGFDLPTSYIGNPDSNWKQLVAITNGLAIELRDLRLQYLIRQNFTDLSTGGTVDLAEDPEGRISWWPFPSDFYAAVPNTVYQNGRIDMALWPTPAEDWAYLISRTGPQTLRIRVRTMRDRIYVFSPDASQSLQFEYISSKPITVHAGGIQPSAAVLSTVFTTDADTWDLDDRLIELAIKARYKGEKGLDSTKDEDNLRLYTNELRGRDQNATTIRPPWSYPWQGQPFTNLQVNNP
jgi:hypothetical protein